MTSLANRIFGDVRSHMTDFFKKNIAFLLLCVSIQPFITQRVAAIILARNRRHNDYLISNVNVAHFDS